MNSDDPLKIGPKIFRSRLLTGTGKFSSKKLITPMLEASGSQMITVALRRVDQESREENILDYIPSHITLLPNTSGARNAEEAVRIARIARAAGLGDFIKIEVIQDMKYLMPDNLETLKATEILAGEGFVVLPYVSPDVSLVKRLTEAGASAIMPLASAIGSNRGLRCRELIEMMLDYCQLPLVVDAGLGRPSHAAEAMEMGADAVLVNTAIAVSHDPVTMGRAFSLAVEAGRSAYLSCLAREKKYASASSPLTGFLRAEG